MNKDGTCPYKHDADAWITKGTAKVLVDLPNGEHRSEIAHPIRKFSKDWV